MTLRTIALRLASMEEARSIIKRDLVGAVECDRLALDCALLRSSLWALSEGQRPIHSLRLLNLATDVSFDTTPSSEGSHAELRARLRNCLDELTEVGDFVPLAHGRWLPGPTRQVPLGTKDDTRLLVGGFPSSLLTPELVAVVRHQGAFRRTNGNGLATALALPSEALDSWIGGSPRDLKTWTQSVLEGEYEPYTERNGTEFILYAPQIARQGIPQLKRWFQSVGKLTGRFLGRCDLPFGIKQYRAVEIISGKVARLSSLHLGLGDLRRLRYGLDALAKNPVEVLCQAEDDERIVVLGSEVPSPERRFFAALGQLTVPDDKYYPRTWRFPVNYWPEIVSRLTALEVRLVERLERGKR